MNGTGAGNIVFRKRAVENAGNPELHLARFLSSQAIPLAMQGIPAVYFHSLTATRNQDLEEGAPARTINRRKWRLDELGRLLDDPCSDTGRVFKAYRRLLKLRGSQPAFPPPS